MCAAQHSERILDAAKAAVLTVGDQSAALALYNAAKNLATALVELRAAAYKAQEACTSLKTDSALDQVHQLERELVKMRRTADARRLVPLPGETADKSAVQLGATFKMVGSSMAQLLAAAAQGNDNYAGIAAPDTTNALRVLAGTVRGIAATTDDRELPDNITDHARDVMNKSANLSEAAK